MYTHAHTEMCNSYTFLD